MKNRTLRTWLKVGFALLTSMGFTPGSALAQDDNTYLFDSPFDTCFKNGYHMDRVTSDQAYDTARCFTSLLETANTDALTPGASTQTILRYAASWYEAAAKKGHTLAQTRLEASRSTLKNYEQNTNQDTDSKGL